MGIERPSALKHPVLFTLVALAMGPLYTWVIVSAAWSLPWTRGMAIDFFESDPQESVIPFSLACVSVAWLLRKRIASSYGWNAVRVALLCALLGGPFFPFFRIIESLFLVPGQEEGIEGVVITLGGLFLSVFFGGVCGALFLPVSLPLSWCSVQLLRLASGGQRQAGATA